jgi:hypothetical protein
LLPIFDRCAGHDAVLILSNSGPMAKSSSGAEPRIIDAEPDIGWSAGCAILA